MDGQAAEERLRALIEEYFKGRGLLIVEFSCRREGRTVGLRVLADRPDGGINMDECAGANRDLAGMIDAEFGSEGGLDYTLEVSSPGADRPLRTRSDFARCIGAYVHFFLKEPVSGKVEPEGVLEQVCGDHVVVEIPGEGAIEVPFGIINMAKQVLDRNRE